jgi:RimJ/RimL family protein N-acetyltransferase
MADAEINPIIRGAKVYLRPFENSDKEAYKRWRADADPMATAEFGYRAPLSDAEVDAYFGDRPAQQGKGIYQFIICTLDDEKPIGNVTLFDIDLRRGGAELGIVIGEADHRGKGFGTDACNAVVDFSFGELRLERVYLATRVDNPSGQAAYEKCGFKKEGILRHGVYARGKFIDVVAMSILLDDWQKLKRKRSWDYSKADWPKSRAKGTGFRKDS